MGEDGLKIQTLSYKMSKFWDVVCSMVTVVNLLCYVFESC